MFPTRSLFPPGPPGRAFFAALRPGSRWFPVVVLGWLALGSGLAHCAMRWHWPLPFCLLRAMTGVPCPACGCTRSLEAWAHFDLAAAAQFNPLFCLACLGLAGWAVLGLSDVVLSASRAPRLEACVRRLCSARLLLGLAALNWLYLCCNLPK